MSNAFKLSILFEPGSPFESRGFDSLPGFPWRSAMNRFGPAQPVDGLGQRVVTATLAVCTWCDACLRRSPDVANADVLRSPIGLTDQHAIRAVGRTGAAQVHPARNLCASSGPSSSPRCNWQTRRRRRPRADSLAWSRHT